MPDDIRSFVIDIVSKQIGIPSSKITDDTIVPDIEKLATMACFKVKKVIIIEDLSLSFTVKDAIKIIKK